MVYVVGLIFQAVHGLALAVGAIVVYANLSLAGLKSFPPLGALVFYVAGNVAVAVYTAVVLALMIHRRRAAIANSIILDCLAVVFLVSWNVLGEKSGVGVIVDSLPGLVGIAYLMRSRRVRSTFIYRRASALSPTGARLR